MELVVEACNLTSKFPVEEKYGLISQIRRCSVSIPSNIAEGKRRGTYKEFRRCLLISFGSGSELETQIEIGKRLYYAKPEDYLEIESLLPEVMKILNKMIGG